MRQGTELDLWCKKQCHWVEAWVSKNAEWTSLLLDSDLKQICKAIFPMLYLGFYERALLCIDKFKKTTDQRLKCHFHQIKNGFFPFLETVATNKNSTLDCTSKNGHQNVMCI